MKLSRTYLVLAFYFILSAIEIGLYPSSVVHAQVTAQAAPAPVASAQAAPAQNAQAPFPPLNAQTQKYLDDLLAYWAGKTDAIERYRCDFQRWTFDPTQAKNVHSQYAKGVLRFMKPDKGLFKVEELYFNKGTNPDGSPNFGKITGQEGDWWICDGEKVHQYDRTEKHVDRFELPPEMRGVQVYNSPLPFLFGVKADDLNKRYWIQPIVPPNDASGQPRQDILALEAFPKFMIDGQNYVKVRIYLDRNQCLPASLELFLPNWNEQNDSREVFEFTNREVNWNFLDKVAETLRFKDAFIPQTPEKGWTITEHPFVPPANDGDRLATPPATQPGNR